MPADVKPEAELRRQELMQRPRDYTPAAGTPSGGKILRTVDIEKATHFTFAGGYAPILKPGGAARSRRRRVRAPPPNASAAATATSTAYSARRRRSRRPRSRSTSRRRSRT